MMKVSGLDLLQIFRPFSVGDIVSFKNHETGEVTRIKLTEVPEFDPNNPAEIKGEILD